MMRKKVPFPAFFFLADDNMINLNAPPPSLGGILPTELGESTLAKIALKKKGAIITPTSLIHRHYKNRIGSSKMLVQNLI